ncbi:MAG: acyl carrier protein [Pseudomonadota bacterium]
MTITQNVDITIAEVIRKNADNPGLGEKDDFFDSGISSLTVVNMQMEIENILNKKVETKELMKNPSIDGWVSVYSSAL